MSQVEGSASHRSEEDAVIIFGQGEAGNCGYHCDSPAPYRDQDCVECAYPLLVDLEQSPERFWPRRLLRMHARLTRLPCCTILNHRIRSPVVYAARAIDWLVHLYLA